MIRQPFETGSGGTPNRPFRPLRAGPGNVHNLVAPVRWNSDGIPMVFRFGFPADFNAAAEPFAGRNPGQAAP